MKIASGAILFFILSLIKAELTGDNVCTKEIEKIVSVTRKVTQNVQLVTTEACGDVTKGFMCPVTKNGSKVAYKTIPEVTLVNTTVCCEGYGEVNGECKYIEKQALASSNNTTKIGLGLATFVILSALLAGAVLYYRKKYHKEKDPKLPTVSYKPEPDAIFPDAVEPHREFQNPLFSRPVEMTEAERQLENIKIGGKLADIEGRGYSSTKSSTNHYEAMPGSSTPPSTSMRGYPNPNVDEENQCMQPLLNDINNEVEESHEDLSVVDSRQH